MHRDRSNVIAGAISICDQNIAWKDNLRVRLALFLNQEEQCLPSTTTS